MVKSQKQIEEHLIILAKQINEDYSNVDTLDIVCFVNGASVFCSDLVKLLNMPIRLHHFSFSSYEGMQLSGEVRIEQDIKNQIENRHVLLLEGLIISGRTPLYLLNLFTLRMPKTIKLCSIGVKKRLLEVDIKIDYHLFEFGDEWIEGYGIGSCKTKCLPYLVDVNVVVQ
mgnify:CR=1 FL=1